MHHLAVADVNADVVDAPARIKEQQVAGAKIVKLDNFAGRKLSPGSSRNCQTSIGKAVVYKSAAVESLVWRTPAIPVLSANLRDGMAHDIIANGVVLLLSGDCVIRAGKRLTLADARSTGTAQQGCAKECHQQQYLRAARVRFPPG